MDWLWIDALSEFACKIMNFSPFFTMVQPESFVHPTTVSALHRCVTIPLKQLDVLPCSSAAVSIRTAGQREVQSSRKSQSHYENSGESMFFLFSLLDFIVDSKIAQSCFFVSGCFRDCVLHGSPWILDEFQHRHAAQDGRSASMTAPHGPDDSPQRWGLYVFFLNMGLIIF